MKKWLSCLLTLTVLLSLWAVPVSASEGAWLDDPEPAQTETAAPAEGSWGNSGRCGEDLTWTYDKGTLTISGSGPMDDFSDGAPWQQYKDQITRVELTGSVTTVGAGAFTDYDSLKTVDLGNSLVEIGSKAFSSCDGLTSVDLPGSFRVFGEESFSHCSKLETFRFEGGFPSFRLNCMWGTNAKLIYPASRPWPLKHIKELEEAFHGRIEFLASDGTDPYDPEADKPQETQKPTEPETKPTQAPTEAPTEAPTQAPTTAPTQAPTLPPETQPETQAPETAEPTGLFVDLPETPEAPEKESRSHTGIWVAVLAVVMVLSAGGAALAVLRLKHTGRDFDGDFRAVEEEDEPQERSPVKKTPSSKKKPTQAEKEAASRKGGKFGR